MRVLRRPVLFRVALLVLVAACPSAGAQTINLSDSDGWQFIVVPYLWATAVNGTVSVGGDTQNVDLASGELFDRVDLGGELHFEAMSPRWGGFVDTTYVKATDDFSGSGSTGSIGMRYSITEAAGFLRWLKPPHRNLDLILGVRAWSVEQSIDPSSLPAEKGSESWVDFLLGLRVSSHFAERWVVAFRFDAAVGGSNPSWNTCLMFHYVFPKLASIEFGYRYLKEDYEQGTESDRFAVKMTLDGPIVGVGFRW